MVFRVSYLKPNIDQKLELLRMNVVSGKGTWEHAIRDDLDFERHVDYLHFNLVKHGYVTHIRD